MYADSHCHLDDHPESQLKTMMDRAKAQGVELVVGVGTTIESSEATLQLSRRLPGIIPSAGVHPWWAVPLEGDTLARLRQLAGQKEVAAIGEVGVDLERQPHTADLQWQSFRAQVSMARELDLPMILHCRGARAQVVDLLQAGSPVRGVLHGFTGDTEEAQLWMKLGLYIGVGWRAFTRNASPALEETIKTIPLARMLLETDSSARSYASEEANEPARVIDVAQAVARLHRTTPEEVGRQTTANLREMMDVK